MARENLVYIETQVIQHLTANMSTQLSKYRPTAAFEELREILLLLLGPFQVYNGSLGLSVDQYHCYETQMDFLRLS